MVRGGWICFWRGTEIFLLWFRVDLLRRNSYHGASTTSSAGSCRHHLTLGDMGEIFCDTPIYISLFLSLDMEGTPKS